MDERPIRPTLDVRRDIRCCPVCGQRFSPDAAFCPFDGSKLANATFDPLRDPLLGVTVEGRYEVIALLGEGGMGQVFEVRHVALDRRFALKALRRELSRDEDLAGRFIDEAKATASIHHPNVVQITDFGRLPDGAPYFVMELLVGETLARVIKAGGPIPAAPALRILKPMASALAAAHDAGVVHRDLKPDNVFLVGGMDGGTPSDDVRIVDFGAAKIVGSSRVTRQGIVFGTPHYMSPEQAAGHPVDLRADVYALGVIMYEMFTGRVPFEADTYMGVLTQHMFVKPVPPSQIAAAAKQLGALEDVTLRCLEKKPEDRYASMREVEEALDACSTPGAAARAPRSDPRAPRLLLADELEPPTLEEMRGRSESTDGLPLPTTTFRAAWILAVAGVVVTACVVAWMMIARSPQASSEPAALPASAAGSPSGVPRPPALVGVPGAASPSPAPGGESAPPPPAASEAPATARSPLTPSPPPASTPRRPPAARPAAPIDDVGDPFAAKH